VREDEVVHSPGVEIRVLADSGRSFELSEPELAWVRVDYQTRLQFGDAELVIECPFELREGGTTFSLDPNQRVGLGPVLDLYPDQLSRLTMAPDGTLEALFASGAILRVPPDPRYEAWTIGGFSCPPGGFASQ
jgi:hypothetical protein